MFEIKSSNFYIDTCAWFLLCFHTLYHLAYIYSVECIDPVPLVLYTVHTMEVSKLFDKLVREVDGNPPRQAGDGR
jgi:hypothetical protein